MKIVLNNEERKSFEGFIIEYLISCKTAINGIGSDEALDMLKVLDGKDDVEVLSMLAKETGVSSFVDIIKETQEETTYSVSPEIFIAYNSYLASSMRVLRPYTDRLTYVIYNNKDELEALAKKMPKFKLTVVNNVLRGIFSMVGLDGLYTELFDLVTKFNTDENGKALMVRLSNRFKDIVESNKIMTDYLNDK